MNQEIYQQSDVICNSHDQQIPSTRDQELTGITHAYRYFLLGNSTPVRVSYNREGLKIGAEVPDENMGSLRIANTYLSKIEQSGDVEEIDESEFLRLAESIMK